MTVDELRQEYGLTQPPGTQVPAEVKLPTAGPLHESVTVYVKDCDRRPDLHRLRVAAKAKREIAELAPASSYKSTPLQAATAEWLGKVDWNLMVTFTFRGEAGVSLTMATILYGRFIPRLRKIVMRQGSRKRRMNMAAVVENSHEQLQHAGLQVDGREGTHIHVLLQVRGDDPYKYKDAIEKAWKATDGRCGDPTVYCPNSNEWYLPLTSDEMREGYTGYILKHQSTDTLGLLIPYLHLD